MITESNRTYRTALITGASRGLGSALACALAQAGWRLILNARGSSALEQARADVARYAEQADIVAVTGDVSDPETRRALAQAARAFGGLDVLVNNASLLGPSPQPRLLDYPIDVLEAVYRVNVFAPLALTQALLEQFVPGGRIINVTSDAGVEAYAGWGGYGSSKAALEHLSAIMAEEEPQFRIYWVDPGDMRTQMHQEAFPDEDISDRPLPDVSVPGILTLLEGDFPSGRYVAREVTPRQSTEGTERQ